MGDYSNVIQGMFNQGPKSLVTSNIGVNPDQNARAYELEQATGVPSSIINGDIDQFESQHKAALANDIVGANPYISDYVNSHPMAAGVSNDDYGQLDKVSQTLLRSLPYIGIAGSSAITKAASKFAEAFEGAPGSSYMSPPDLADDEGNLKPIEHPGFGALAAGVSLAGLIPETGLRAISGLTSAMVAGGTEAIKQATGKDFSDTAEGMLQAVSDPGLWASMGLPDPLESMSVKLAHNAELRKVMDDARVDTNQAGVDAISEAVKEAQSSTTKERAPELFKNFVEQHVQDARMGISGNKVLELYGDKVPTPDDNILGWVPDLQAQMEAAKDTGADISVPLADYISKVDPAIHKELEDDLRVVPGGVTKFEAEEAAKLPPPVPAIEEAVPTYRNDVGMEPLFSIGDRKLELKRLDNPSLQFGPSQGFHDFDMVNENGQRVGTINISEQNGGKELYIDNIGGAGEYYHPNNFGPALMRDLLRQIKQLFPNAETLTGHRVTGMRGAAGTYIDDRYAFPKIRLDGTYVEENVHDKLHRILGGSWSKLGGGLEAYIKPAELWTQHEQELAEAVRTELDRTLPSNVQHSPVSAIKDVKRPNASIQGLYYRRSDVMSKPFIAWALNASEGLKTARHESIHHLREAGFFTPEEWQTLEQASIDEGWEDKHKIAKFYGKLPQSLQMEESIAEAYPHWVKEFEQRQQLPDFKMSPVDHIFQRIQQFLEAIKSHVRRITGTENFDDIFQKVYFGELKSREPVDIGSFEERHFGALRREDEETPISEPGQGIDVQSPFNAAKDVGMTLDQHKNYMKLIEARQQADLKASTERALREQTKRQSDEWKAQSEAMRPQVVADLSTRPDIAADKFFGLGELMGQKLDKTYRLDWESLTPEQRKMVPESYTVRKGGVKPDEVASLFGYQTGDQMLAGLSKVTQAREASGMRRDRFDRMMVNNEIQRRMEQEHGYLDKNILEDTKDQVLSENQLNLLHEETMHLATMSGETPPLTQDMIRTAIKEKFDALPVGSVSSDKYLREAGKQGKLAELSLLQNKPADAYRAKQVQFQSAIYADLARKLDKERAKLDKAAKPFRKQGIPKNIDAEYANHVQDLLSQAGYRVGRSVENIQENIGRRGKTVEQFANEKLVDSFGYRDIPIADVIVDGKVRPVDEMATRDFLGFKQTVDALIKNGKDEQKIIKQGETADRSDVIRQMKEKIERFPLRPKNETRTVWDKLKDLPKSFIAGLTNMETFLNRMGDRDPESVFNKYVTYPAAAAANRKAALQREFSGHYRKIGEIEDKDKLVSVPFLSGDGTEFTRFTRGNLGQVIQNMGNESNIRTLVASFLDRATGKPITPEVLKAWVDSVSRPEDWTRAQALGKEVFGRLIKLADQEYEHIHGITIDKLPLNPFTNTHGTFDGWYHPLVKDPLREGKSPIRDGAYDDSDFGHITTANGYTRKRSGAAYPLDLNPDMTPVRMNQMIHDISFRSFVLETNKLFQDPGLSNTITNHYGAEYNNKSFLIPWLKAIAGQESIPSRAAAKANQVSEWLRQNVIGTYIGFNPFTAMKHGPTALVMSMRQVGPTNFLRSVYDLYGRSPSLTQANHEFVMRWSEEVQRRERHWQDTLFGAHSEITGANSIREHILEKGSWLVAKSDMLSAKPTWLAEYRSAQDEGLTHGESIDRADAAVRMAHGSTAITNQPGLVRGQGALHNWLTSVYGFFGTAMQRRIELAQDIHDTFGLAKQGELNKAAANIPSIMTDVFTYVIWPTIVEEAVTGLTTDDRRGWLDHIASAALLGLSSSVLYARDIVNGLVSGHDAGVGLISSPLHDVVKAVKDDVRKDALTKARMGKTIGDTLTALGHLSGMAPKTIDNAIHFGVDLVNGAANPHSAGDWLRGITKGTTKERVEK